MDFYSFSCFATALPFSPAPVLTVFFIDHWRDSWLPALVAVIFYSILALLTY